MDIKSFVVALGGLILTGISLYITLFMTFLTGISIYLTYRARTSPYREALYSKQLEGHVKLASAINDFNVKAVDFINKGGLKTEEGPERQLQALKKLVNVGREYLKWTVVLGREIGSFVEKFIGKCERILNLPFNKENKDLLGDELIEILNKIRNNIGTEPLSQETLKLIMKIPS